MHPRDTETRDMVELGTQGIITLSTIVSGLGLCTPFLVTSPLYHYKSPESN